jgi:hypothetical protein
MVRKKQGKFPEISTVVATLRANVPGLKASYTAGVTRGMSTMWRHWYSATIPPAIEAAEAISRGVPLSDDNYKRCAESAKQIRAKSLEYQLWKRTEFKARLGAV